MEADGGSAKHPTNKAGAKYGTGYCDAQCPHDEKFIWGEPTQKIGTMTWAIMVAAAPNSTSGRPTSSPMPTLLTLVRCRAITVARAANAEMDLSGRTASATRTAAT